MRVAKQVQIIVAMDSPYRLHAQVHGRFGAPEGGENGVYAAVMLGSRVQPAVEEFGGRLVSPLTFVPETSHRIGLTTAASAKKGLRFRSEGNVVRDDPALAGSVPHGQVAS